jgi:hypothetical protein
MSESSFFCGSPDDALFADAELEVAADDGGLVSSTGPAAGDCAAAATVIASRQIVATHLVLTNRFTTVP